ncbi:MAG: DUF2797 domain-containing protein [Candidatus Thermoplasmatota archaeon]|nr:DUF2797 domain-containing protein [Candidatus Thermoplasmatota archaeon]
MEDSTQVRGKGIPHERCARMTLDMVRHEVPYHVIGYSWEGGSPSWTLLSMRSCGGVLTPSGDPFDIRAEEMKEVNLRTSGSSYCVGRFDNGKYIPCPDHNMTSQFAQCNYCMSFEIPDPSCIFEPHCSRGTCGAEFCQIEHVVYLTGFRERTKVGMTQLRRFETRGMEQGADVILPLLVLGDRYSARVMEWRISKLLGLPQSVPSSSKISGWGRPRDDAKILKRLSDLKIYLSSRWDEIVSGVGGEVKIEKAPIEFEQGPVILKFPLEEPLPSPPRRYHNEIVRGDVIGYKGNYLVFRSGGLWAWRIGETPGRIVYFSERLD